MVVRTVARIFEKQLVFRLISIPKIKHEFRPPLNLSLARAAVEGCLCALALIVLSPALFLIAVTVFLESGSPILFSQARVGRNGKLFRLLKFRTMYRGMRGPSITAKGDSRVTRAGRVLRKLKLDELPQLWHVVRGEMSLVGPRPELPEFVDMSDPIWRRVLAVRPGITDSVSIAYRNEEEMLATVPDPIRFYEQVLLPEKLKRNLVHLEKRSLWNDVQVLMGTVRCVAFPEKFKSDEHGILRSKS